MFWTQTVLDFSCVMHITIKSMTPLWKKKTWTVHNKQRMINFCAETMRLKLADNKEPVEMIEILFGFACVSVSVQAWKGMQSI